jgi:hypothetical protein
MLASGTQDRGFQPGRNRRIFFRKGSKAVGPLRLRGSRIDKAKFSRPFLARSFPFSLIEDSVRPERLGALPREGRTLRPERFGALPRGGRTLGAVRVPL